MQILQPAPCCNPCCPTTLLDLTALINAAVGTGCDCKLWVKDTVADMRTITAYDDDWSFITLGGTVKADGLGKDWYYDSTSLAVDTGDGLTTVIRPDNKPALEAGRLLERV